MIWLLAKLAIYAALISTYNWLIIMRICKICLRKKKLRYASDRVGICPICTKSVNGYKETADKAYEEAKALLMNGMMKREYAKMLSTGLVEDRESAVDMLLKEIERKADYAMPRWVNKLVADKSNTTKMYKMIRAYRRGLLHFDIPNRWGYPNNWKEVATNIRHLDNFTCVSCGATDVELHVHHIVYVSNYGTNQKNNLVTLCRKCHEKEHKKIFDFGENMNDTDIIPEF
ncbi:MAG: HNH endonuclease [Methylobacter sp.]